MFNQVKALFDLKKEIPDAVGYDYDPPYRYPIPKEMATTIQDASGADVSDIAIAAIRVDNFSSIMKRDVRILYRGEWMYAPDFRFSRRDIAVKYRLNLEDKEILLEAVPPNETVYISIFNPSSHFDVEQVLIGDQVITALMQQITENKRYPTLWRMKMMGYAMMCGVVLLLIFLGYVGYNHWTDYTFIRKAQAGQQSCSPNVYINSASEEAELVRKYDKLNRIFQSLTLDLNKVATVEELKRKDRLILCEPESQ